MKKQVLLNNNPKIECLSASDAPKTMKGVATVFNTVTDLGFYTLSIDPKAFDESLNSDDIVSLINHDMSLLLGRTPNTLKLEATEDGLISETVLPNHDLGSRVIEQLERGDLTQMSVGFYVQEEDFTAAEGEKKAHFHVTKAELYDTSVVTFGQYGDKTNVGLLSANEATKEELEEKLKPFLEEKERLEQIRAYLELEKIKNHIKREKLSKISN